MMTSFANKKAIIIAAICVLTFFCFSYALNNEFTNWDDDYYVTKVDYIKALTPHNLKIMFSDGLFVNNPYQPNYHPFCMLSLAINYYFAQLNPTSYYLTNILLHICNVIFVFLLFFRLCGLLKIDDNGKLFVAAFGALWFGIHPMHVESVCWIAERKDVLYAFFYLLGLLSYVKYTVTHKAKWYWVTFVLFVASCLSKPMAVVFPLSLVCLDVLLKRDYFVDKKINKTVVIEKILFFLTSLTFGIAAFYTQHKTGAIASFGVLTIQERVMYAGYGFVMYVAKMFNPTFLSTFYPYPYRYIDGWLPGIYYAAPFIAIAILAVPTYIAYKKNKEYFRIVVFGLGFFLSNVIFVLQFISVGAAIMADRYSYVAYIGLFFMIPWFCYELIKRFPSLKTAAIVALVFVSLVFSKICYDRTAVWHNAETLLTDAIEKYPMRALLSYKWLGNYYFHRGEFDKAMENYSVLTTLHASDANVDGKIQQINYVKNGGTLPPEVISGQSNADGAAGAGQQGGAQGAPNTGAPNTGAGQPMSAGMKMPLNAVPQTPTGNFQLYLDSSFMYCQKGDTLKAFRAYINAFRFNQGVERIYADSSFKCVQSGKFDLAINQYGVIMKINTGNPYYYFYRGVAQFSRGKINNAIDDWEASLKVKTKESKDIQQSASYNLSVALDSVGKDSLAVYYVELAKNAGYAVKDDFIAKLKAKKEAALAKKKRK